MHCFEAVTILYFQPVCYLSSILCYSTQCVDYCRENLVTTAGASMGLVLLSNLLFTSTDLVFVENPTYFVATKIVGQDCDMTMVPGNGKA